MGEIARVGLTITGTVVGSMFGAPGLGAFMGSAIGGALFPRDRERVEGPRLDDLHVQISAYGAPIPMVWGTMRMAGNVIWAAPITEIKTDTEEGGKGGVVLTDYRYFGTFAVAICAGPVDKILRIWADTKLVYNVRGSEELEAESDIRAWTRIRQSNALQNIHVYQGTETQEPDIWIESYEGAGNVPAHRGMCYVVFKDFALADFGNRIPNFSFEVSTNTTGVIPYDGLYGIQGLSASDNIVFTPDNMYFVIESGGLWRKVNTISNEVVAEATFTDIPDESDFDIDAFGTIYTTRTHSASGKSVIIKLSQYLDDEDTDSDQVDMPWRIRVSRLNTHPYIVVIPDGGETLEITTKDFEFDNSQSWVSIDPPFSYVHFVHVDIDDTTGDIWAVCKDWADSSTYSIIMRIRLNRNGSVTSDYWVKTPDLEKANYILYDTDTDQVIVASTSDDKIVFYDAGDSGLAKLGEISGNCTSSYMKSAWRRRTYDGFLYFAESGNTIKRINVSTYDISDPWTVDAPSTMGEWNGGSCYDPLTHSVIVAVSGDGFDYAKVYLERSSAVSVPVSEIIEDICDAVGFDSSTELDVTDLESVLVHGYCINQQMPARSAIQTLMDAYFFDGVESDGLLKFPIRGGSSVVSIDDDDLAAHVADSNQPQKLITSRQQELELPRVVELAYIDYNADYATGVQRESRQVTSSSQMITLRMAIAMDHDEARQVCAKLLANAWMGRNRHFITVSREFAYLDSADVITLTEDDNVHTLRIEQPNYQGGVISLDTIAESASVYASDAPGVPLPGEEQDVDWPGPTTLALIDCPLLSSSNNTPGIYVATLGMTGAWRGAIIYKSNDDGVTWPQWAISNRDATIGNAATALGDVADPFLWDEGNTVRVRLFDSDDTLESDSEADVLAGANHGILGDEIIAWKTATLQTDGSYLLSGLLRGRNGTEWATGDHAIGETFVVLNTATIHFLAFPVEEKDLARDYVAISIGMGWGSGLKQEMTCEIRNMMPLAPVHVKGTVNDNNDLTITWIRRVRYGGEWLDGGGPPLGETMEQYEIDILDGDGDVLRTITAYEQTATYTAAQQTADGLTPGGQVDLVIYQISSVVGRGFGAAATVNQIQVTVDLTGKIATADGEATDVDYAIEDQVIP